MVAAAHFDVVVVGSGFGGAVTAHRLSDGGLRVCVLERGKAYPPGSFPRRPREMAANVWDPSAGAHGLYNVWSFRNIEALVASGLGGGSLIYANVLMRKDERWFTQPRADGPGLEDWPVSRADLEPHYDAVEAMLGAQQFPFWASGYQTGKTQAMREAAAALGGGVQWGLPPLAVSFSNPGRPPVPGERIRPSTYPNLHGRDRYTCRLCGECDIGCNDGAKNTLDHTYLSAARHSGAQIRTRAEVRTITPLSGGYEVGYVEHLDENEGRPFRTNRLPVQKLTATRVVLAAGALGTPYLLLRNRRALPALGPALGTRFCGNGDLLSFVLRARSNGEPRWLDASRGPVITSYIRTPDRMDGQPGEDGPGHYIEDAGYPVAVDWLLEGTTIGSTAGRLARFVIDRVWSRLTGNPRSDLSRELGRLLGDAELSASSLPLLGMGRDVPDGTMRLRGDFLDVRWSMKTSMDYFERVDATMSRIAKAMEGDFKRGPLWPLKRVITVHPLGGCPMSDDPRRGVVDAYGETFGHPGLYVADGSVMPGPVGPNPSLTIAAFADRMAERMLETRSTPARAPRVDADSAASGEPAHPDDAITSLEFTEEMKGFVTMADVDYEAGYREGRDADRPLMFHLTITVDDVGRFVADPDHVASARGWVECPAIGGRLSVERGLFNLFVDTVDGGTNMRYLLWLIDGDGEPVTLSGFKVIRDDPGFDLWSDTTTLFIRLLEGHVEDDAMSGTNVGGTGIITIHPTDFLRQLTTFRTSGGDVGDQAGAFAAFGALFMGKLWDVYRNRAPLPK